MRTDIVFYHPYDSIRLSHKPSFDNPQMTVDARGRFRFNAHAREMLGLEGKTRLVLGNSRTDPREWFLMLTEDGGHGLRTISGHSAVPDGFICKPLYLALRDSLPHAPKAEMLVFKIEAVTHAEEAGGEMWPLLTAPYWQPPQPKPAKTEPGLSRRVLAMTAPPGLLGMIHYADLPE